MPAQATPQERIDQIGCECPGLEHCPYLGDIIDQRDRRIAELEAALAEYGGGCDPSCEAESGGAHSIDCVKPHEMDLCCKGFDVCRHGPSI